MTEQDLSPERARRVIDIVRREPKVLFEIVAHSASREEAIAELANYHSISVAEATLVMNQQLETVLLGTIAPTAPADPQA